MGWSSLWVDFVGWTGRVFGNKNTEIIWVCAGNLDRSASLLQNLVSSLTKVHDISQFGLSVFDCGSTDITDLEAQIRLVWKGPLVFQTENTKFSRAVAFNHAINQANGNLFFVCDADIRVPSDLADQIRKNVKKNSAWFPICQWQIQKDDATWRWFTEGTGLFAATGVQLKKTGLYDEKYDRWGKEDWDLFFRFYQAGIAPHRSRCIGLYHVWHPSEKPADFEKMF